MIFITKFATRFTIRVGIRLAESKSVIIKLIHKLACRLDYYNPPFKDEQPF
jgi:hypothetical protein